MRGPAIRSCLPTALSRTIFRKDPATIITCETFISFIRAGMFFWKRLRVCRRHSPMFRRKRARMCRRGEVLFENAGDSGNIGSFVAHDELQEGSLGRTLAGRPTHS